MRNFWKGNLQVGLVSVPVGLASAVQGKPGVGLTRLHRGCGAKVDSRAWCPVDERALTDDEVVRGYEIAAGQYVQLEDNELAAVQPADTRTITMVATIPRRLLDELQAESAYYLTPANTPVGRKPYELFRQVLADHPELALLCRLVVRNHEWVAIVRAHPHRRLMLLEKLAPEGAIVPTSELEHDLRDVTITDQERDLARELVLKHTRAKLPKDALRIAQGDRIVQLVEAKLAGDIVHQPQPPPAPTAGDQVPVGDLADALRRSLHGRSAKTKPRAGAAPVKR